jgi:chromosome segregation ATPase
MEEVERREQDLIQHVRTSGMRKPRETALVDEILDLRRVRRQLCSVLVTKEQEALAELASVKERAQKKAERYKVDVQSAIGELKTRFQAELVDSRERMSLTAKKQLIEQKREYENKMKALTTRIQELEEENILYKKTDETIQSEHNEAKKRMQIQYHKQLEKYQTVLKDMASKTPQLESAISRLTENNDNLTSELNLTIQSLEKAQDSLQKSYIEKNKIINDKNNLMKKYTMLENDYNKNIDTIRHQHSEELTHIDNKVRQLVITKDNEIGM